ncbi:MAG TPA: type II CAAX endopeptidase family protein [Clostridia bacterium]|nr:type II CAAX endopeptidase family protein [Clostridia bacterium]
MRLKAWLLSRIGCIAAGAVLTMIVLAESVFPPWAPYFIIYALLALVIPIVLKSYRFGAFRDVMRSGWKLTLCIFVIALAVDQGIFSWLYEWILAALGLGGDTFYSLNAALIALAEKAAVKFNITQDMAMLLYALFVLIWAPIGEELFYRGYIQETLRKCNSFKVSALVSAGFFGIRHMTHLFFLWPDVPFVASCIWALSTFVFGMFMSRLYEKTSSLYPVMLVHAGVNLIELVLSI